MRARETVKANRFVWMETFAEAVNRAAKVHVCNVIGKTDLLDVNLIRQEVEKELDIPDLVPKLNDVCNLLLSLVDRHDLGESIEFQAYILSRNCRWHDMRPKPRIPEQGPPNEDAFNARGYQFSCAIPSADKNEDTIKAFLLRQSGNARKQQLEAVFRAKEILEETEGCDVLYVPLARYDEIYLEFLSGVWCAAFFCGLRLGSLEARVRWVVAHRTSVYPSGVCEDKLAGDMVRGSRRRLLKYGPLAALEEHPETLIDLRLRCWSKEPMLLNWKQYCDDQWPTKTDEAISHQCDLTTIAFRNLGGLYLLVMLNTYISDQLPITYLFPKSVLDSPAYDLTINGCAKEILRPLYSNFRRSAFYEDATSKGQGRRFEIFAIDDGEFDSLPPMVLGVRQGMIFSKPAGQAGYSGILADEDFLWGNQRALKDAGLMATRRFESVNDDKDVVQSDVLRFLATREQAGNLSSTEPAHTTEN